MKPDPRDCAGAAAFALVGERYSSQIWREVSLGLGTFEEIARGVGAPRDILTARLKTLVEAGVLARVKYSERPPRFRYELTDAGRALQPVMQQMAQWGERWLGGTACTKSYHRHDHVLRPVITCSTCGETLAAKDVSSELKAGR